MGNLPFPSSDVLPRDLRVLLVPEETPHTTDQRFILSIAGSLSSPCLGN